MESDSTISWLVLAISIGGYVLVSVGWASLASVRREHVQWLMSEKEPGASALDELHTTPMGPGGVLSLLGALFLASGLLAGAALAADWTGTRWSWIAWAAPPTLAVMAVTHVLSRAVAAASGERVALRSASLIRVLARLFSPILAVEAGVVLRMSRVSSENDDSSDEAKAVELGISVEASGEPLDEREVSMIRAVVQLDKTTAREIMVPRVDVVAAELGTSLDDMAAQMVESGHSRIPIFQDTLDHVQGIAYARDVLSSLSRENGGPRALMADVIRPALFIPESKTLEELLNEFQERRIHIAMVIDEYGGVSGMVTIEDLLEEIVGEIQDEFDVGGSEVQAVNENEFMMDARVSLDELNERFNVTVEGDGFDTVGGFVYQRLGKIPSSGDRVEYDGLMIEVVSTVGRRLKRLRVVRSA